MKKEIKRRVEALEAEGWTVHRVSQHIIMRHPSGAQKTLSGSPSDNRGEHNERSQARRAVREATDRQAA